MLEAGGSGTLLDLACGDGFLLALLAAGGRPDLSLLGIDLSTGELDAARRRLVGHGVTLCRGSAHALPIAAASLDHVVCHMALMLMDEVEGVLAEVSRVLKTAGTFAAVVGARPPPSPILDAYLALLSAQPRAERFTGLRFGDRRLWSRRGIGELFSGRFDKVSISELVIRRRCSPRELCAWFEDTYDFHLLAAPSRRELKASFATALAGQCDGDGQVEYSHPLHLVTATAVRPAP